MWAEARSMFTAIWLLNYQSEHLLTSLTRTLKSYAEKSGQLDKVKVDISGDDFREGLTAVISIKVAEPQFEGQTKTKLGNSEAMGAVDVCVGEMLGDFLEENPKEPSEDIHEDHVARDLRLMHLRKGFRLSSMCWDD